MAQENAEKVANAKKAAADAERRAAARQLEDNLAERMEKLQARLGHAPHPVPHRIPTSDPSPHPTPQPTPLTPPSPHFAAGEAARAVGGGAHPPCEGGRGAAAGGGGGRAVGGGGGARVAPGR